MTKSELQKRWTNDKFVAQQSALLEELLRSGKCDQPLDFRGIFIGQPKSPPRLRGIRFVNAKIAEADFSSSRIATRLENCLFVDTRFADSKLTDCSFYKCRFESTSFESASISAICNDSEFLRCDFGHASWQGAVSRICGGRRNKFVECSFISCEFKQVEFRATHFTNCNFTDANFIWCELAHVNFEGNSPSASQITGVDEKHIAEWLKGKV